MASTSSEDASELSDSVFRSLGSRGRFQVLQLLVCSLGGITASYQLYGNIFIGKDVPFRCAEPPPNVTSPWQPLQDDVISSRNGSLDDVKVRFDECKIVVSQNVTTGSGSGELRKMATYECEYGYYFEKGESASFMSEFGLVCDRYLLVSLAQTFVVLGQGIGAFFASIISDRFGRKRVLIGSQLGLMGAGLAIAASPSFPLFVFFKCLAGLFQQGVVTAANTMGIELFPRENRSLCGLVVNMVWAFGVVSMAPWAYLLRHQSWRYLQYCLSGASVLVLLVQFFFVEESIRWLLANGKEKSVLHVLKRAARANRRQLEPLLALIRHGQTDEVEGEGEGVALRPLCATNGDVETDSASLKDSKKRKTKEDEERIKETTRELNGNTVVVTGERRNGERGSDLHLHATRTLTFLDMLKHKILLKNACIIFFAWFTVAFVVFALYMMSTSYAGDPYLNYFLMAFMEVPPTLLLYFGIDKLGRKPTLQAFFAIAGVGCIGSAICRIFQDRSVLGTMSAVFAMVGLLGSSGAFDLVFFYTTELFPTNFRNQAMGTGSAIGRVGGMIAPFMKNLLRVVVWGPGVITGSLCVMVVVGLRFLPETRGKALPTEIEDVEAWYLASPTSSSNPRQLGVKGHQQTNKNGNTSL